MGEIRRQYDEAFKRNAVELAHKNGNTVCRVARSTTGDIYTHFLKKADQAAAEKMDDLMTRRKKKQEDTANSGK